MINLNWDGFFSGREKILLVYISAITISLMAILNWVSAPLVAPQSPYGMISFELAGSVDRAAGMLDQWDANTRLRAAFSLGLDYLFMLAYPAAIGLACRLAAGVFRNRNYRVHKLENFLIRGQWLAAALDATENIALFLILLGNTSSTAPLTAYWCAIIKFSLVISGIIYALFGLLVNILKSR